ncbi:MAG: TatD family hydrolase [Candidatus Marinimicrobia bacterium]|nr:TatD family hydrolase [Candidatus Neomarinimicrobiota bacterium]
MFFTAKAFLDLGFYISFAGNLTFKNTNLRDVAKAIPLEKTLVETDSPFLSPMPFRGKRNEPARTRLVAEQLAEVHGKSLEEVAEVTTGNGERLFNI